MKKILILIIACFLVFEINAQGRSGSSKLGKSGVASIRLIDKTLIVHKDLTNSIFKFEIINNNSYPIYIPRPEALQGAIPQYFDLHNLSVECESSLEDLMTRSSSEFILIPANGAREFELHSTFFQQSCLSTELPIEANIVYRAYATQEEDKYIRDALIRMDRDARDIVEYLLTTSLKSAPIKIVYE